MVRPVTVAASREQENSGLPSISTMQAPHCSVPQPNLVPRRSKWSCSTVSSGTVPSQVTETARPLTTKSSLSLTPAPFPTASLLDLDTLGVDEFRPVPDLVLELDLQRRARRERRIGIDLHQPVAHRGILHRRLHGLLDLGADRLRHALRRKDAPPEFQLDVGHFEAEVAAQRR